MWLRVCWLLLYVAVSLRMAVYVWLYVCEPRLQLSPNRTNCMPSYIVLHNNTHHAYFSLSGNMYNTPNLLRGGFNKKTNIKSYGILHPNFPPPPPPFDGKKHFFPHNFLYVFIMFIITKFGENFEEKIDICFFYNVLVEKVVVKKSD